MHIAGVTMAVDLVLSSGFLAFARHAGFLRAVEEVGLEVSAICGTSSGALAGAMWAAGLPAEEIAKELSSQKPISVMQLNWRLWRGLFSLKPLVARLADNIPASFEQLRLPFAAGIMAPDRSFRLLHTGSLVPAVAASCAIPYVFAPVLVDGQICRDGGAVDRLGLDAWRLWRGDRPTVVHLVERSHGPATTTPLHDIPVVRSPRSGAGFFGLGDFWQQYEYTFKQSLQVLRALHFAA